MRDSADDQVFIIRCWNENADIPGTRARWRMRVVHVNRSLEAHFNKLEEICDFVSGRLSDADAAKPAKGG